MPLADNWERAIPFQKIPTGLTDITARSCAVCHQEHYEEWRISTHAHAWTDLQFQAELKKESSPYLCINCHIPLENQQEFLISGLREGDIYKPVKKINANFNAEFQQEGISCATCHVRDGYIIGTGLSSNAPHPVKADPDFLNENLCITCHNANAVVTPELVCSFETGDEWKNGPYFGKQNCISCHMDTLIRSISPNYPERSSHRHWFPGSGIPKLTGQISKSLQGMAYTPDSLQSQYKMGKEINFNLTLENQFAGHRLPSGDPERFYMINLLWTEAETGDTIASSKSRIGEVWEWYPEAKKLSDNNMNIGEKRIFNLKFSPGHPGKYSLLAKVTKHRMDEKTADYNGLGEDYPIFKTDYAYSKDVIVVE